MFVPFKFHGKTKGKTITQASMYNDLPKRKKCEVRINVSRESVRRSWLNFLFSKVSRNRNIVRAVVSSKHI